MSDPVATVLINGFYATIAVLIARYFAHKMEKMRLEQAAQAEQAKRDRDSAAKKVEEVRVEAKATSAKVEEVKTAASVAAVKVDEVKHVLEESTAASDHKLDGLAKVAAATHVLVNSNMSVQLKISAVALRRIADLTNEPEDVAAAELAERMHGEHVAKQAIVDAQPGTDAEKQGKG